MIKPYKILVVEDSSTDRHFLENMLNKSEFLTHAASSAQDALTYLSQEYVDLILCDYLMPDMDGLDFVLKIRNNSKLKNNIIIIITSDENKETKTKLINSGANDLINKGASVEEIIGTIYKHLNDNSALTQSTFNFESYLKTLSSLEMKINHIDNKIVREECLDLIKLLTKQLNNLKSPIK